MSEVRSHTVMFRTPPDHGERMDDDSEIDAYWFVISSEDSRLTGYVSRKDFNWLAEKLGVAPLADDLETPMEIGK